MYDLFNPIPDSLNKLEILNSVCKNDSEIHGLTYVPNFLSRNEEEGLLNSVNSELWLNDLKRRVQHYGYKYDYKARAIDYNMYIGILPDWANSTVKRIQSSNYMSLMPDQLIINEYLPGQGIANHVDCEPCFDETIVSISLGSAIMMDFVNINTKEKKEVYLERGSLVAISGEARHLWTHGIAQRKSDIVNGIKIARNLRVSMTFRKVLFKDNIRFVK